MKKILSLAGLAVAASLAFSPVAFAADEYNVSNGRTLAGNPLGMHGVDPVAFQSKVAVVEGTAKFASVHDGVEYYFSSAETKAKFDKNPNAYLPQNGGFCTVGITIRKKLDGDPRYADIVDGKLYLFVNEAVFAKYKEDKAGTIAKADEIWKEIRSTPVEDL